MKVLPGHVVPLVVAAVVCAVASGVAGGGDCPQFYPPQVVGTVQHGSVDEASGLVASRANPGVLWVHNDSGGSPRVFAMSTDGTHLGIYNLSGAGAADWEDMAVGPGPTPGQSYLYLGDIGDNNAVRSSIDVYRVAEPAVDPQQSPVTVNLTGVEKITLTYADGPRDAETLLVDPVNGDLYVVSKRETPSRVYRSPGAAAGAMQHVANLTWGWATGGDVSPDGDEILIRGYSNASIWQRASGTDFWDAFAVAPCAVPVASEPQGEAISFDAAGWGYYTVSEQRYQPIYYCDRVPEPATALLLGVAALGLIWSRRRRPLGGPPRG